MDLKKLEMFRLVAQRGSVRLAATEMGLTIPAISTQIKKLERELGVGLFDHRSNKLVLTAQGQAFLSETAHVFEALNRATAVVSGKAGAAKSAVSLVLSSDVLAICKPRIAAFVKRHPEMNLSIRSRSGYSGLSQVMDNEADLCIGWFRTVPRGLHKIDIAKTGVTLVHSPQRKIDRGRKLSLQDIARHRLVLLRPSSSTFRTMDAAFHARGIVPSEIDEVANCQMAMDMVEMNLAVGLVHGLCAESGVSRNLVRLDASHCFDTFHLALLVRAEAFASGIHQNLIEALTASWQ
jgi:DNA-binding transcriptional LysR family regulator